VILIVDGVEKLSEAEEATLSAEEKSRRSIV